MKINLNLLNKTSRQRCGDFVPTIAHTNTPDGNFNKASVINSLFHSTSGGTGR